MLLALFLAGCVAPRAVPQPSDADVSVARGLDPRADLPTLRQGRERFVARCSGCHTLPTPRSRTPAEWRPALAEMSPKAELAKEERRAVELYVLAVASRRDPDR